MLSLINFARFTLIFASFLLIAACTPTLNWREVRLESADARTLKAQLPCKPDAATRQQQLGDFQVQLSMMGCVANEITFTLSRIPLKDPLMASQVLAAWQAAAVRNLRAKPASSVLPIAVSGAGTWPPAARMTLIGATAHGDIAWFAAQTPTGLTLYQAAMYVNASAKQPDTEAVATFFESLQLQ
jgi:hypothetical protein